MLAVETTGVSIAEARYYARKGFRYTDKDAEIIGPVLHRLARENRSNAEGILEEGFDPSSPIHGYFDWDNDSAAHSYRLQQARKMAQSIEVEVIYEDDTVERVREFLPIELSVSDNGNTHKETHYTPIELVRETPSYASQVVRRFERDAIALYRRNKTLFDLPEFRESSFGPVMEALETVAKEVEEE